MRYLALLLFLCSTASAVTIDYPADKAIFPPDLAPPTFLFRDTNDASSWRVEVRFNNGSKLIALTIRGERLKVGEIDPRAVGATNELPTLTSEQQQMRTWKPDPATWAAITRHSSGTPATLVISGPRSRGQITFTTSKDPVSAPIFFRDVPLMPAEVEKGVIKPLAKPALPLVAWRLRYVSETSSRKMIDDLPTCMNCHSFSRDGKTLGIDVDGPQNDKGLYALVPIGKQTSIQKENVVAWSSFKGKLGSKIRVGFMSQVSPDGQYVVTMVNGSDVIGSENAPGIPKDVAGNFYVSNFKDYRFLQVFYPTRGVLAWYSRETGKLQPLPGAEDPRYVHTNATWTPDGKYLIFARAEARDPYPPGTKLATKANDPEETQIRYDLYRVPFNGGKGGTPEPVSGASNNGMSNSFPKVSPDGRWIVFVKARNGLLMRPDGLLHIVPFQGGEARRMSCNTPLMNSWHSFSPNGRWMVFASKSRSPYTQMYLTHIDENGNDSPPILVENATAANRAVNIPEFVNIGMDEWLKFDAPATDFYRFTDGALKMLQTGRNKEALGEFRKLVAMEPDDTTALNNYGAALSETGDFDGAAAQLRKALEIDPENIRAYSNLGVALGRAGKLDEASAQFAKAFSINPQDAKTHSAYGAVLFNAGRSDEARPHLEKALDLNPGDTDARNNLGGILARAGRFAEAVEQFEKALGVEPKSMELNFNLGRALAAAGRVEQGIVYVERAVELGGAAHAIVLDRLSGLYAAAGRLRDAASTAKKAYDLALRAGDAASAEALKARIAEYEAR